MNGDFYEEILAEVLAAAEDDHDLSLAEIVDKFPGHEGTARRVLADICEYRRLRSEIRVAVRTPVGSLTSGERLGDFEIEDKLASGGQGVIYRARQRSLGGRLVALKVLPIEPTDARGQVRFEREALALAGLHHRHLAEVFGFGEERRCLFFAMRLIDGPSLRDVLNARVAARKRGETESPGTQRVLVERICEIADALAAVHAAGLVHRDVKPSNIMLESARDGRDTLACAAVLVDFGLVRPIDTGAATLTGNSPATPSYAPPEQLLGQDLDASADVFALGVTLHDLLAARAPHERMQASVGLEPIDTLARVDADLAAILGKSVDPAARWRYANAAQLRDDLRAWLAGKGVTARRTPPVERIRRWASQHPRRIAQVALVTLALVVFSVGVTGPVSTYRGIRAARAALDRGDVRDLSRIVDGISPMAPIELVGGSDLSQAAERLRSHDLSDALVRIRNQLELNDMSAALFTAAEAIGEYDLDRDNLIERFFIACGADDAMRASLRSEDAEIWATLMARIFYERPVLTGIRRERAVEFRSAVLRVWDRQDVGTDERRFLLTALSGCGEAEEVIAPVLMWTFDERRTREELRQGMLVAERILRRSVQMGMTENLDWNGLWWILRIGAVSLRDRPGRLAGYEHESASIALCLAALIATPVERRIDSGWQDWLPRRSTGNPLPEMDRTLRRWLVCMAVGRDEPLMELLRTTERPAMLASVDPRDLGTAAGVLQGEDQNLPSKLRAWVFDAGGEDELDDFDRGITIGRNLLHGARDETALDADTLLGYPIALNFNEIPHSTASDPSSADLAVPPPSREDPTINFREHENLRLLPPEAMWTFHADTVLAAGTAIRALERGCTIRQESRNWFARLPSFGHSELHLEFDVGTAALAHDRFLILSLQTNGREYYPDQGRAPFELRIGDSPLATYTCNTADQVDVVIEVPARWLRLGVNTISLRLLPSATTPLRLWSAKLKCLP